MFEYAIIRKPATNFDKGIKTSNLGKPEFSIMMIQHQAYANTLRVLGLEVTELEPEPNFPDAYFVEDTAVVTPDIAVITNPGAIIRQGEEKSIEPVLAAHRPIERIEAPGTVDGGDVLSLGSHFYIGISERTNRQGADQLGSILKRFGNTWSPINIVKGLHLKSSINYVGRNTLLLTETYSNLDIFKSYKKIVLASEEEYAANSLLVNDNLIMPDGFPKTRAKLECLGFAIHVLDMSEVQKMDGGLTCLSLRF